MQDCILGNVLHRFHHAGEELPVRLLAGRERDAAVAEQRRRDAVPGHRRDLRIPANLRVQMRVQIDEPRRHVEAVGADFLTPFAVHLAHFDDGVAINRHVRLHRRTARAVHQRPASNYQIVTHRSPPEGDCSQPPTIGQRATDNHRVGKSAPKFGFDTRPPQTAILRTSVWGRKGRMADKPLPAVGYLKIPENGKPYLQGCKCSSCGAVFLGERDNCSKCGARGGMEEVQLSNQGELYSYCIVHRSFPGHRSAVRLRDRRSRRGRHGQGQPDQRRARAGQDPIRNAGRSRL